MSENKVKRYYQSTSRVGAMHESDDGTYILSSDYELLKAKLDKALEGLKYIGYSPTRDCKEPIARKIYEELSEGDK